MHFVSEGSVHNGGEGTCHVMTVAAWGGDCAHPGYPIESGNENSMTNFAGNGNFSKFASF